MKRNIWLAAALLAACVAPVVANSITLQDSYGTINGGEFVANTNPGVSLHWLAGTGSASRFETFCIEKNEYLQFGPTYHFDISQDAVLGGVAGGKPDPLSGETKYLYCQFIKGQLVGYDYGAGAGRVQSANALQNAIWYAEEEITNIGDSVDGATAALAQQFYDAAVGKTSTCTWVMNLWWGATEANRPGYGTLNPNGTRYEYQSLLVCVPAPGAALLVMIGLGFAGWIKRRLT